MLLKNQFYFIRHGETEYNAKELCAGGTTDIPLNSTGISQAENLNVTLNQINFGAVFSSPLTRAMQTAKLATKQIPRLHTNLREWELGDFEGTPANLFLNYIADLPLEHVLPGGESKAAFFTRTIAAINEILTAHENPIIVAHGGTYWAILKALEFPHDRIGNAKCIKFLYAGSWQRVLLNDVDPT